MRCAIYIKRDKWRDFEENAEQFGFTRDWDGDYCCTRKVYEDSDDYEISFFVGHYSLEIEVTMEIHSVKNSGFSFEIGPDNFEPLWHLGAEGYLEVK